LKEKYCRTSNKTGDGKILFCRPSDIIKVDLAKRKQQHLASMFLFLMKADGDIFI
jgi:hypothetical protein